MGNAVGPVALIAAGIYLGYLTLAGKTSAFVALLKGTTPSTPSTSGASTPQPGDWNYVSPQSQASLNAITNPYGVFNPGGTLNIATPQQQLINSQIPLTIDPLVGTSGG